MSIVIYLLYKNLWYKYLSKNFIYLYNKKSIIKEILFVNNKLKTKSYFFIILNL